MRLYTSSAQKYLHCLLVFYLFYILSTCVPVPPSQCPNSTCFHPISAFISLVSGSFLWYICSILFLLSPVFCFPFHLESLCWPDEFIGSVKYRLQCFESETQIIPPSCFLQVSIHALDYFSGLPIFFYLLEYISKGFFLICHKFCSKVFEFPQRKPGKSVSDCGDY